VQEEDRTLWIVVEVTNGPVLRLWPVALYNPRMANTFDKTTKQGD
jgi:hypothetical protein